MSKKTPQKRPEPEAPKRPLRGGTRRGALLVGVAFAVVVAAGAMWLARRPEPAGVGTPRLAVDRTDVDLGYVRFDTPARVVFTLTNTGTRSLRVTEMPRVKLVAGC